MTRFFRRPLLPAEWLVRLRASAAAVLIAAGVCPARIEAQPADPAFKTLERAYEALRETDYDRAIAAFRAAAAMAPNRASIRKDLAYVLLKTGENEAARDEFAAALKLDPGDVQVALEYAFLCYETGQRVAARRIFAKYKEANQTAAEAFENIDRPLREGIARWKEALAASPDSFSGHEELAKLAEQRDEMALAAEHYERAWRLRPERRDLLLDLGRVWKELGRDADAGAALLAASRSAEPRVRERAKELLGARYPWVSEFEKAIALDPGNISLRRELAFLELQMNRPQDAEAQFAAILAHAPDDLLSVAQLGLLKLGGGDMNGAMPLLNRVLAGDDQELAARVRTALERPQPAKAPLRSSPVRPRTEKDEPQSKALNDAKDLAIKSLEKGYLKDAVRYLNAAIENDPVDFDSMLKLAWTYNNLKDDRDAVRWFSLARRSPDGKIAAEAERAYRNLEPEFGRFQTTVWAYPTFSTRWHDLFAYSQVKTELRLPRWFLRPYVSGRFIGDTHDAIRVGLVAPQYLSEQSLIGAIGVTTPKWHSANAWFEAGEAMRFRPAPLDTARAVPDYRGGVSFARAFGESRMLAETNDDLIYVHRFDRDTLFYSQNRLGYKAAHWQAYWNVHATTDLKREHWANYFETGPGVRFRVGALPFLFSVDTLQGAYLDGAGTYHDLRVGLWYAFTR